LGCVYVYGYGYVKVAGSNFPALRLSFFFWLACCWSYSFVRGTLEELPLIYDCYDIFKNLFLKKKY